MAECIGSAHPLRNGDEWLFKLRLNSRPSNLRNEEKENLAYFGLLSLSRQSRGDGSRGRG
jgi:hypothetical protein